MTHRKIFIVIGCLAAVVIGFIQCGGRSSANDDDPRGRAFAGAATCAACHADISKTHLASNHFRTSSRATPELLAKFISASNHVFHYRDSSLVRIDDNPAGYQQSWVVDGNPVRSQRMDLAVGSANKAQSYLFWSNEQLFELPLTYFSVNQQWSTSPGFPIDKPFFDRVIISRCLECHASYARKTDFQTGALQVSEKIDERSIIFGIDCERCHGPAAQHVEFQQQHPDIKQARFMTSIKGLTRQQKVDLCASCHSGNDMDVQRSLFGFRPGDTLSNFYYPSFGSGSNEPDVHGKQMQLLQSSQCYRQSDMTCGTCHGGHEPELKMAATVSKGGMEGEAGKDGGRTTNASQQARLGVYMTACMNCHQASPHSVQMRTENRNCINCHMPLQASKKINVSNGQDLYGTPYLLRTHRIAIYPGADTTLSSY